MLVLVLVLVLRSGSEENPTVLGSAYKIEIEKSRQKFKLCGAGEAKPRKQTHNATQCNNSHTHNLPSGFQSNDRERNHVSELDHKVELRKESHTFWRPRYHGCTLGEDSRHQNPTA